MDNEQKLAAIADILSFADKFSKRLMPEEIEQLHAFGLIRKIDLKDGHYYFGKCRNASVAMWNHKDQCFLYMRTKFEHRFVDRICHPEDDDGYDLFLPVAEVTPTEDQVIYYEVY